MESTSIPGPDAGRRRGLDAVVRAVALTAFLLLVLWIAGDVLLLVFGGILVAIFLHSMSDAVASRTKLGNGWSMGIVLLSLAIVLTIVGFSSAPEIAQQVDQLGETLPRAVQNLRQQLEHYRWAGAILDELPNPRELRAPGIGLIRKATGALSNTLVIFAKGALIFFIGLYIALNPRRYRQGLIRLFPMHRRERVDAVLTEIGETLRAWLIGKVLSGVVIGVATYTGLELLGIPLAMLLGLLAGLLSFIPNFGPIISAVPAILLGMMQGFQTAMYVGLLYLGIQVVETYFITPWLEHRTASLPPALTIVMQVLLGVLFGGMGVLLAGPLTATGLVAVRRLYVEDVVENGAPAVRSG